MPWIDRDHEPEVITVNGLPTAQFVLIGDQTPAWRSNFTAGAAEYRVRAARVEGGSALFVPLPDITNVYGVLNAVTGLLEGPKVPRVPPEVSAELIDNDELRTVTSRVRGWWESYKQANPPEASAGRT